MSTERDHVLGKHDLAPVFGCTLCIRKRDTDIGGKKVDRMAELCTAADSLLNHLYAARPSKFARKSADLAEEMMTKLEALKEESR